MTDIYCKIEGHNKNQKHLGGYIYLSDFDPIGLHRDIAGRILFDLRFEESCMRIKKNNEKYKNQHQQK